jgi:hypothetical protein
MVAPRSDGGDITAARRCATRVGYRQEQTLSRRGAVPRSVQPASCRNLEESGGTWNLGYANEKSGRGGALPAVLQQSAEGYARARSTSTLCVLWLTGIERARAPRCALCRLHEPLKCLEP